MHIAVLTDVISGKNDPLLTTALKELGLTLDQVRLEIVDNRTYIYRR